MRLLTRALTATAVAVVLVLGSGCAVPGSTAGSGGASRSADVVANLTRSATSATATGATETGPSGSVPGGSSSDGSVSGGSVSGGPASGGSVSGGSVSPSPTGQSVPATTGSPVEQTSQPLPGCSPETLRTVVNGTLTFATSSRPAAPWFVGKPADGRGYEAAVATAVANRLGYDAAHVRWVTADRAAVLAGTASGFDGFIGLVPIPDQPPAAVQFSTGYLDNSTVLLAPEGSALAAISSVSQLVGNRIGVLGKITVPGAGTPVTSASAAISAVGARTLDGVIATVSDSAALVGRSGLQPVAIVPPPSGQQARQFGFVLPRTSTVAPCISAALDILRIEGGLTEVAEDWLPAAVAPRLSGG